MEVWKPVVGWENEYKVSDEGRVRSLPRLSIGDFIRKVPGKIMSTPVDKQGYPTVILSAGRRRVARVHKLVAEAFIGPCPDKQEVRHLDGVKANNTVANLAYGTSLENKADYLRHHGAQARARLTKVQVLDIIERIKAGEEYTSIGNRFGVAYAHISAIGIGRTWKSIPRDKLTRKPSITEDERETIIRLRTEGRTINDIKKETGRSNEGIRYTLASARARKEREDGLR